MILHGKNIILKMNGMAIAAAKSCEVNVSAGTIPTASPSDGAWESSIPGRKSWSASCSHLVKEIADSTAMVGQTVTLTFQPTSDQTFAGIVANPTLQSDAAPSSGSVVYDSTRKDFLLKYSPAQDVTLYWQTFDGKPAKITGAYYYDTVGGKCYKWTGTTMTEVSALTGSAIVKQWRGTFTQGNISQGSYSFEGSGALTTPAT